ncbi:plasmid stabilization protein [Clostridium sp. Cult2]|uniref:plasmid stabilization protein n=1 Tax=Clostridium sp. Cult2 TaxID=2079003 RepID=UPI001F3915A5|nr:plasmid stabilization protein [Clostridium sp. Cult2]MCF6466218.1 plasmid stabilization protein [Clostridium sp. Cult2]
MTNEEFQKIVLGELRKLNEKVGNLEQGQMKLEQGQVKLEQGQEEIRKDLKAVIEQTADLTEFREEINTKVDKIIEELNTIEIVTSKNWNDIAKLKSIK